MQILRYHLDCRKYGHLTQCQHIAALNAGIHREHCKAESSAKSGVSNGPPRAEGTDFSKYSLTYACVKGGNVLALREVAVFAAIKVVPQDSVFPVLVPHRGMRTFLF